MVDQYLFWSIILGALSAVSLPLGSLLGLFWHPNDKIIGALTAFGGGALIAALAIELVAPTAMQLANADSMAEQIEARHHLFNMLVGAIIGGILFVSLDFIVNSKGGFLRKVSTTISYFTNRRAERRRQIVTRLSTSELIRHIPLEMVEDMVDSVRERKLTAGERLFDEGDEGDVVYFIEHGRVSVLHGADTIATLNSGDVFGEIAIVTGSRRTASAIVEEETLLLELPKEDFDHWRKQSSVFDQAVKALASNRLMELVGRDGMTKEGAQWANKTISVLRNSTVLPTDEQLHEASYEHGGAPMAIWLGILLDGIPESFVIGSALVVSITVAATQYGHDSITLATVFPYTLIAGLFLANFPEAMSSSIGMQKQGWGRLKILSMWLSLTVMTSIGAGFGYWLGGTVDHSSVVIIEGLAAGAMLTMIAAAMIPEAVHLGGSSVTGLGTLTGFLSAVAFKFLE